MIIRVPPKLTNRDSLIKYIEIDLWSWLKDLTTGILKINFKENFQSFTLENIDIPANTQITIYNQFKSAYKGVIPSGRIITRQQGNAVITDGDLKWTESHVYLKNESMSNDVKISVIFFK